MSIVGVSQGEKRLTSFATFTRFDYGPLWSRPCIPADIHGSIATRNLTATLCRNYKLVDGPALFHFCFSCSRPPLIKDVCQRRLLAFFSMKMRSRIFSFPDEVYPHPA